MREIAKTIVQEWTERKLPTTIERAIKLAEYSNLKTKKIVVVTGFRRVGKTYLMFNAIKKLIDSEGRENIVYLNFEDERIPAKTEVLTAIIPATRELSKERLGFLFLDELQEIPGWSKWLRRINDTEAVRIFVSGSSSKMSSREIPTELRGRFLEVKVFPLSFKEYLDFEHHYSGAGSASGRGYSDGPGSGSGSGSGRGYANGPGYGGSLDYSETTLSEKGKSDLLRSLREYLTYGGLPEIALSEEARKVEIANSYYQTVVRRDIVERYNIKNEEALKSLLRLLLNSTQYSISKLYKTLKSMNYEIGKTTLQNYISHIENSYFMFSVPIFSYKIKNQLQYPRKNYFIDNIFISKLSTNFSNDYGRLYENVVAVELKRRAKEIFYWNNSDYEVDFVVKDGTKVTELIQVCYDTNDPDTKMREVRALIASSKELKCNNLLVITEDYESKEALSWFGTKRKIKFVPLWKWLLQAGK